MIKLFEQYNEYSQVVEWLEEMGIKNFYINDDLTVDVDYYVNLFNRGLTEIPIQFGKVSGFFDCSNNYLISLKGCPMEVGNDFNCACNQLTSLEYTPSEINGDFDFNNNQLSTLKGCPKDISGRIRFIDNPLPDEVLSFIDLHTLIKHQGEYSIWNDDGSFNKGRWNIFYKEYYEGKLDNDND